MSKFSIKIIFHLILRSFNSWNPNSSTFPGGWKSKEKQSEVGRTLSTKRETVFRVRVVTYHACEAVRVKFASGVGVHQNPCLAAAAFRGTGGVLFVFPLVTLDKH